MQRILTSDSATKQDPSAHTANNATNSANTAPRHPISGQLMSLLGVALDVANSLEVSVPVNIRKKMPRSNFWIRSVARQRQRQIPRWIWSS